MSGHRSQHLEEPADGRWRFEPAPTGVHAEGDARESPRDTGKRFATLARPGRGQRPDTETRITLDAYEGNSFGKLHVWQKGMDGNWYPTRKVVTLRQAELLETIKGLCAIARELGVDLHPQRGGEKGGDRG